MRKRRLFWRLLLGYLSIIVIALGLAIWHGGIAIHQFYENSLTQRLTLISNIFAQEMANELTEGDTETIQQACQKLAQFREDHLRITVILPSGRVVGDSWKISTENHAMRPEIQKALHGQVDMQIRTSATVRQPLMYVAVPVYAEGQKTGPPIGVVRASMSVRGIEEGLSHLRASMAFGLVLVVVLVTGVSFFFSRQICGPLEELQHGALRLAEGELQHRLARSDIQEIDDLADAMNRMAEQWSGRVHTILRQQNELDAMLSSMSEGVLAIDQQGTILLLNESANLLLGVLEPEESKGRNVGEVIRKEDLLRFVEMTLQSDRPVEGEVRIHTPAERVLRAHGTTLRDAENQPIGAMVVLHDITQLRRLENVRRDFVANVSHELRTPITSIKGFVETLLDGALNDQENAERFLNIILRHSDRLDRIIEDLLLLSRVELEPDVSLIETSPSGAITDVARSAIELCQKMAEDNGIKIEYAAEPDLYARMNTRLLEQAIVNLLDNAIKYSETKTSITVRAYRDHNEGVIEVADEGRGIEAKHLPRLFERFYRVDKSRSRQLGGTGLGLAIVKHITIAHGGRVDVTSQLGEGSTFSIRLPLVKPPAE